MKSVDAADRRILSVLQEDGSLSVADIAERIHLSTNACWRRLRRLETEGIIRKRVALVDPEALDLSVVAFVRLRLVDRRADAIRAFVDAVSLFDGVLEIQLMASDRTILLKTCSSSIAAHGRLLDRIADRFPAETMHSDFVQQRLYQTTALPT